MLAVQIFVLWSLESLEDVVRGDLFPPNPATAIRHAQDLAHFESAHFMYIEPQIQTYFYSGRNHWIGSFPSWALVVDIANNIYAWLHIAVPFGVLIWVYVYHRQRFGYVRNVFFLANLLGLVGYFVYPVAPPRLTPGLFYQGHPFHFIDTMQHQVIGTRLNGRPLGFNPYAAMPSIHVAWSVIVASSVILLARRWTPRILAACYPLVILFAVIVTANHYVMDGVGALLDVAVAALLASLIGRLWAQRHHTGVRVAS